MLKFALVGAVSMMSAGTAYAAEVVVTPASTSWKSESGNSGTAKITGVQARSGNGSLELTGDRTRFYTGGTNFLAPAIASLKDATSLTFDWRLAGDSVPLLNPDYTPALRLIIKSGISTKELIWEGAYNGVYGATTVPDQWYSSTAQGLFYLTGTDVNSGKTIADWASSMSTWSVIGISVGQGSSAGAGYHAFVDNVTFSTKSGSTTYNFETPASAVPEPATWAMMILGLGMTGYAMRRRGKVRFNVA
jgi:hypothetical protein